jgi:hypothetical protein
MTRFALLQIIITMDHSNDSADQRYSGLEVVPNSQPKADQPAYPGIVQGPKVLRSYWRRKWGWFILFGVVVIGAIVGGVVGGVVGGAHKDSQTGLGTTERPFPLHLTTILTI